VVLVGFPEAVAVGQARPLLQTERRRRRAPVGTVEMES